MISPSRRHSCTVRRCGARPTRRLGAGQPDLPLQVPRPGAVTGQSLPRVTSAGAEVTNRVNPGQQCRKRSRTSTSLTEPAGLSRLRLPFRHPGRARATLMAFGTSGPGHRSQPHRTARAGPAPRRVPGAGWRSRHPPPCRRAHRKTRGRASRRRPPAAREPPDRARGSGAARGRPEAGTVNPPRAPRRRGGVRRGETAVDERSITCDSTPRVRHLSRPGADRAG